MEFLSSPEDKSLSPVATYTLTEYMLRAEGIRKSANSEGTRFFISLIRAHKAVSTATVARIGKVHIIHCGY